MNFFSKSFSYFDEFCINTDDDVVQKVGNFLQTVQSNKNADGNRKYVKIYSFSNTLKQDLRGKSVTVKLSLYMFEKLYFLLH